MCNICHLSSQKGYFLARESEKIIAMFHKGWKKNCPENNKKRNMKRKNEYTNLIRN